VKPVTYARDARGVLTVGGVPLDELAAQYGTPLYVMDVATIRQRLAAWREALGDTGRVYYAGKAFLCRAMAELVQAEGVGLDVVSGGELTTALMAGVPPAEIVLHGNVKTRAELELALATGVGRIVVDSLEELSLLDELAQEAGRRVAVLLRLTPGIEAHTHEFIRTGQFDSKFGFATVGGAADEAVRAALASPGIRLAGLHAHIGSQILEVDPFAANAEALLRFARRQYDLHGWWPEEIDIGGGLGVSYEPADDPPTPEDVVRAVRERVADLVPADCAWPMLSVEPGRSVAADAGVTLYRVGVKKRVPGRTYVAVDGGMGDNIRPALYQARYMAEPVGPPRAEREVVTVAGRYCESGDLLLRDAELPRLEPGDLLAVFTTGAYTYAMASTYNRVPRPAVVAVDRAVVQVWVERESWADLARHDRPLASP
jgi:diaminopimelate decarboxylase